MVRSLGREEVEGMRSFLYFFAKLLGDFSAISKGRTGKRIKRRLTGRFLSRLMRIIILGTLLIPVYKDNFLVPEYYIRKGQDGTIKIYDRRQILVPKYIIRDNKIYEPGRPLTPLLNIKP